METVLKARVLTGKKNFSALLDKENDILIVRVTEQPDKGKANKEIVKELKKVFKAEAVILSGLKSSKKTIKISLDKEQVLQILETQN